MDSKLLVSNSKRIKLCELTFSAHFVSVKLRTDSVSSNIIATVLWPSSSITKKKIENIENLFGEHRENDSGSREIRA